MEQMLIYMLIVVINSTFLASGDADNTSRWISTFCIIGAYLTGKYL